PEHVARLQVKDVDLADVPLPRRAGVEPRVAGRPGRAAMTSPRAEVIALHRPGGHARAGREDLDLDLDPGAAPIPPRPHRIRPEGVAFDQNRHLALDRLGRHVPEEPPSVVDPA